MRQQGKASRTAGKEKGLNCKATKLERYMATRNRSYKDRQYGKWLLVKNGNKPTRRWGDV